MYVIFRLQCRIQTPSRPVSCTGGWVMLLMYCSQYCTSEW